MGKCFAYESGGCRILIRNNCDVCSFYKSAEQRAEGIKKSMERISRLPTEEQFTISDTYYQSKRPWKEIKT